MKIKDLSNASESFKKKNPHLFGLGGLETNQPKPNPPQALAGGALEFTTGKRGVAIRINFICLRRRLLDDDNNCGSIKPLRDAVCKSIAIDDGDPRITFDYHQIKTSGREGVIVHLETNIIA